MPCDAFDLILGSNGGRCGLPSGKNGGLSCFPHWVLWVHWDDNSILAYQGKLLPSTGFLCGQDLHSKDYSCVGTLLKVSVCSLQCWAQAYYYRVIYLALMRKEKYGAFEWHKRLLHVTDIQVKRVRKKRRRYLTNISRLSLKKIWL